MAPTIPSKACCKGLKVQRVWHFLYSRYPILTRRDCVLIHRAQLNWRSTFARVLLPVGKRPRWLYLYSPITLWVLGLYSLAYCMFSLDVFSPTSKVLPNGRSPGEPISSQHPSQHSELLKSPKTKLGDLSFWLIRFFFISFFLSHLKLSMAVLKSCKLDVQFDRLICLDHFGIS